MWYKSIILIIIAVLICLSTAIADDNTSRPISVQAGVNIFGDPRSVSAAYVEFPFSIKRNDFEFTQDKDNNWLKAAVFAEIILTDTLGNHLDSVNTFFYTRVNDTLEARADDVKLFNNLALEISPGIYKADLTVIDVTSKREGSFLYDRIEIDSIVHDKLSLSSIELAYDIWLVEDTLKTTQSRLEKNGRVVIPNPMSIFSVTDTNLYLYAELYNLQYDENKPDSFQLAVEVFKDDGTLYFDYGWLKMNKPGSTAVISNVVDFSGWSPGKYDLRLTATDLGSGVVASGIKRFMIFPEQGIMPEVYTRTYTSPLDTASLQTKTNWIRFVVDAGDWEMYKTLNETGKTNFVARFFREKDPTPGTETNEYLQDVIAKYVYANDHFSTLPDINDGWRTDRGRVLLQYGICDEIDESFAPSYSNPWEIWYYHHLQGGVYFVFEDQGGYGNYRLVHSTAKGEIYDYEWENRVKSSSMEME